MKKAIAIWVVAILLVAFAATAFADSFYLKYTASTKATYTNSGAKRASATSKAAISQDGNINTETGEEGGKVTYGARKSKNTTSGSNLLSGDIAIGVGDAYCAPNISSSVAAGQTIYLTLQPNVAASTGQWEISGYWHA